MSRIPARRSRYTGTHVPEIEEDEKYYAVPHVGSSAIRYRDTEGRPVLQKGNRRYILHPERSPKKPQRHWLALVGLGMLTMIFLFLAGSWIVSTWQRHQLDATYGTPRTYQTDAVVGHNHDSPAHPSHFIFLNLHARVIVIELPAGDVSQAMIYSGPFILGENAGSIPVTGTFADTTGNGRLDMQISFENQTITYLNNGTKFVPGGN